MKKLFFLFVCAAISAACSSEMEVPSPVNPDDDMVEVSFNLGGDYVSVEETPLTRAFAENAKTLYALQIKEKIVTGSGRLEMESIEPYAWGLFTDIKNARISLKKDKDYIVEALVIIEREDTIFNREGHYSWPFFDGGLFDYNYKEQPKITESFIVNNFSINTNCEYIISGINTGNTLAKVDRYLGTKVYKAGDGNNIAIDMDRYAFSFTYNVTPPLDVTIRVKLPKSGNSVIYEVKAGSNQKTEQIIHNAPFNRKNKDDSYDLGILIEWERGNASLESHSKDLNITVKRKRNYNLNINMNNRDNESGFELNMDNEAFEGESYDVN